MQVSQEQTTNVGESRPQCSLAQSVEHAAVNRGVVSSSLTGAAIYVGRKYCPTT